MEEEELGFSGGEEEEEDSGEWTEESEDEEQLEHRVMLKPVFVPKNKRATIAEKEELEQEEERVAEQEAQRLQERKEESKVCSPFDDFQYFVSSHFHYRSFY